MHTNPYSNDSNDSIFFYIKMKIILIILPLQHYNTLIIVTYSHVLSQHTEVFKIPTVGQSYPPETKLPHVTVRRESYPYKIISIFN